MIFHDLRHGAAHVHVDGVKIAPCKKLFHSVRDHTGMAEMGGIIILVELQVQLVKSLAQYGDKLKACEAQLENEKVQRTIVSSDYVRKQMISTLEKFISELKGIVTEMKQLDKELKL